MESLLTRVGRISSRRPATIVEFVSQQGCGCVAESICPFVNFNCSREHVTRWSADRPEHRHGVIHTLDEVLAHAEAIYGNLSR